VKHALVSGSAGFVGRHLVPKLEAAGYEVVGVDPRQKADVERRRISATIADYLRDHPEGQFDVIVHLAANIPDIHERIHSGHIAYSDIPLDYAMADYVSRHPPREAFVWPTSCAIDYPDDPYAWVKLTGERVFGSLKGVPLKVLRPFSGYGGDQALSYPFPAILERVKNRENPLTVWGSGTQVRDFIHIDDLTDAFMWAIDRFPAHTPIDIGTGIGTDFIALARMMADAVGYSPEIKALSEKAESSRRRVANPAAAESCGFKPKISLGEGIRSALDQSKSSTVKDYVRL
jgi:nucleoside-diphosphate-sugar epimerase